MRLLTDPQPAIEWFCTGASVCIGVEALQDRPAVEPNQNPRVRATAAPKLPVRFPGRVGDA